MKAKLWEVKVKLFWSADHIETYLIKANTKQNAEKYALAKAEKECDRLMCKVLSVKEIVPRKFGTAQEGRVNPDDTAAVC